MTLANTLRAALRGLTGNLLRAALTALGVIIGVASVIATLALGNGARVAVAANFRGLGSDQIRVETQPGLDEHRGLARPAGRPLTYGDGLLMAPALDLVDRVEMEVAAAARARFGGTALDTGVTGVTGTYLHDLARKGATRPAAAPQEGRPTAERYIAAGRFFSPAEVLGAAPVCVLGRRTALGLFGSEEPVGQSIWVGRHQCEVIGVLAPLASADPGRDPNRALLMPISAVVERLFDRPPPIAITAYVTDEARIQGAKAQIADFLRERQSLAPDASGRLEDSFGLLTQDDVLGAQREAARTFSLLLTALAAVALAVGGIGIMNVMLVSVSERTREIGVRLAVGAQRGDIVRQFLFESVLLSVASGAAGVVLGVLSVPVARAARRPGRLPNKGGPSG